MNRWELATAFVCQSLHLAATASLASSYVRMDTLAAGSACQPRGVLRAGAGELLESVSGLRRANRPRELYFFGAVAWGQVSPSRVELGRKIMLVLPGEGLKASHSSDCLCILCVCALSVSESFALRSFVAAGRLRGITQALLILCTVAKRRFGRHCRAHPSRALSSTGGAGRDAL